MVHIKEFESGGIKRVNENFLISLSIF